MKLVTVFNEKFYLKAINLIESYYRIYNDEVHAYYFGNEFDLSRIKKYKKVILKKVPFSCPHAYDIGKFFFKSYALYDASINCNKDFIYLDSAFAFHNRPVEIEQILKEKSRFFVQYPTNQFLNKFWTTKMCFELMGCNEEKYHNSQQYWAAIQAYKATNENLKFIENMYSYMLHEKISGPDNTKPYPDNFICKAHRNEQSVFSILIEKNQWHIPYNEDIFVKYGDVNTMRDFNFNLPNTPQIIEGRVKELKYLNRIIKI